MISEDEKFTVKTFLRQLVLSKFIQQTTWKKNHPFKRIILETVTVRMCLLTLDLHRQFRELLKPKSSYILL